MTIESAKSFVGSLGRRSDTELKQVAEAMQATASAFGRPHIHAGVDIRRLGRNLFECRVGLDLRLLFKCGPGALVFVYSGTHDGSRAYLRK
jgi:hypothetical protein